MKAAKLFFILLCLAALIAPAAAAGGSGTEADPYIIETAAEWLSISNNLGAYYELANDISFESISYTSIGTQTTPFMGFIDGKGYTLSDITMNVNNVAGNGVFGSTTTATIKNLNIENYYLSQTGNGGRNGILIGNCVGSTIIDNIVISNSEINSAQPGVGMIGLIYTNGDLTLSNCIIRECKISSQVYGCAVVCGGLSSSSSATISNCDVINCYVDSGSGICAGIVSRVASSSSATISNCDVINSIINIDDTNSIGGICGVVYGSSECSISNCNVINCGLFGASHIGGICGAVYGTSTFSSNQNNVDSCTIIAQTNNAGGILGGIESGSTYTLSEDKSVNNCIISQTNNAGGIQGGIYS